MEICEVGEVQICLSIMISIGLCDRGRVLFLVES